MLSDIYNPQEASERRANGSLMSDCGRYSAALSEVAEGGFSRDPLAADHIGACLRCQAELAQYKKLLRALSNLRGQVLSPDEFLLHEILDAIGQVGDRRHRLKALVPTPDYSGVKTWVATAGAAACTAGAIVLANRLSARSGLPST